MKQGQRLAYLPYGKLRCRTFRMASIQHEITVQEAVKLSGLTRRQITYAASTGKLSTRKLPGRTGAYLLNLDEVRRYAELAIA